MFRFWRLELEATSFFDYLINKVATLIHSWSYFRSINKIIAFISNFKDQNE